MLFIDDDDNRTDWSNNKPLSSYTTDALGHMGLSFTTWTVLDSVRRPDSTVLAGYDLVVWDQPDLYSFVTTPITDVDTASVAAYLRAGGKLWLNAPDIALNYIWAGSPECPSWLHISSYRSDGSNESIAIDSIIGAVGDSLGEGLAINTDVGVHIEGEYSDRLRPAAGAAGCLAGPAGDPAWNHGDSLFYCAVRFDSAATGQKLFYMSTAFQGIPLEADRDTLMARVLGWMGWSPYGIVDARLNRIAQPGDIVSSNSTVPVTLEISSSNVNRLEDVWVHAVVESLPGYQVYHDSVLVDTLLPFTSVNVDLQQWNTGTGDTVLITAWVSVPGDVAPGNDTLSKQVLIMPVLYQTGFEAGTAGWSGDWARTAEYANSGAQSFTDRPNQNYPLNSDLCSILDTTFDLTGYTGATLSFSHCHWLEDGFDYGYVMVSPDGGASWDSLGYFTGLDTAWHSAAVDLGAYVTSSNFKFGFRLGSDALLNMKGWFVDDLVLAGSNGKQLGANGAPAPAGRADALTRLAPNPSAGRATLSFTVGRDGSRVAVKVYNLAGQLVRTAHEGAMNAGKHALGLDATGLSAGVYFVRLTVND
ncbi:T9SS type A sorting domain-containing protein, partial [bacterium]|nr:T9SS type A sorting domain-containing protein [bacterium]